MALPFVFCDSGIAEASIVPESLLGKPGKCPPGIYETLLIEHSKIRNFAAHVDRFSSSCETFDLPIPQITENTILDLMHRCGTGSRLRCRLMAFAEKQELSSGGPIQFLAALWSAAPNSGELGITVSIFPADRVPGDSRFNYKRLGQWDVEQELIKKSPQGVSDLLVLNRHGELCEGVYSNIVVVRAGVIYSPPEDAPCLPGITLGRVLGAAGRLGIEVRRESITDIQGADEIWLTSSIRGLQWVKSVVRGIHRSASGEMDISWKSPAVAPEDSLYWKMRREFL